MERQGVLYLGEKSYDEALSLFSRLTVEFRDIPLLLKDVTFYMGECYYQLGDRQNSILKFESFLSLYSESENREKAIFRLGSLYAQNDNQESAKEYMNLLNSEYPDSEYTMDAHIVLAESYLQSGDMVTARASLNTLLASETDPVEIQKIQYNLARTWKDTPDEALKWYLKAARGLDPDLASESLYQSGRLYDERGEKERTILLYERLFNQYKESPYRELTGEWMAVYYDRNAQDLALKNHLDRMLSEFPATEKKILYLYMRGNISYREGDYNSALRFYQNIVNLDEDQPVLLNETRYRIGYIYTLRKEFSRARGYFEQILANSEKNELYFRALLSTGICALNVSNREDAGEIFTILIESENSDAWKGDAYYYLGQIAMEDGNYYRSSDYFALSVKTAITPYRRAEALYQQGWSQLRLVQFKEAAESFDTLAADYPENKLAGDSLYRAGVALSYLEDWDETLERFIPALELIEYASLREEILYQIAWSYFMKEDFESAMEYLEALQEEFPDSPLPPDGLFRAAEAFQEKGLLSSAVYAYKQVFYLYPDNPLSETSLFRALSIEQSIAERLKLMEEFLLSYPSELRARQIGSRIETILRQNELDEDELYLINEILNLPLDPDVAAAIRLALYSRDLDKEETYNLLLDLEKTEGLGETEIRRIGLYKGVYLLNKGHIEEAEGIFTDLLDAEYPSVAVEAQFYLAGILIRQEQWKEGADAFLRIRYRYENQKEWVSRGLYEAALAYRNAGDTDSYNRTREMLLNEYPDSVWAEKVPEEEIEGSDESLSDISDADPDLLSPPEDILPILGE